jgi:hypothetical protein
MAVVQAITEDPEAKLTPRYLEIMGDYLMDTLPRTKDYLTPNRLITINKHETSFEGLLEKFESGEDGVYHLFADERNTPLTPKLEITEKDIAEVPGLAELRDRITAMEETVKRASGKDKYVLKKHLIEMRKEQYLLKDSHYQPMQITPTAAHANPIDLAEKRWLDENGEPQSDGLINLFNAEHVSHLLTHYADLKIFTRGKYDDDFYYLIETFTDLMDRALADFPIYAAITDAKIEGRSNEEI